MKTAVTPTRVEAPHLDPAARVFIGARRMRAAQLRAAFTQAAAALEQAASTAAAQALSAADIVEATRLAMEYGDAAAKLAAARATALAAVEWDTPQPHVVATALDAGEPSTFLVGPGDVHLAADLAPGEQVRA